MSNNQTDIGEGFWKSKYEPDLPSPIPNDEPWEGQDKFVQCLKRIESNAKVTHWRGFSGCRVCGCMNGSREFSYNGWKWPAGFMHYIIEHNVQPSAEFQEMINKE